MRWLRFLFVANVLVQAPAAWADEQAAPESVVVRGVASDPRSATAAVVEKDVLTAAPHRTGGDLLLLVPGMFVTQHGGQGKAYQIFYRGFDSVHGQDVEIDVAGAPVNDVSNVHGQGYADLNFVPPEVVRSMTALPGAYDPSQGDFAVAGSVRFELGLDEPGITLKGILGSYGEKRLFVAFRPAGSDARTFGAAEVQSSDGFGPNRASSRASGLGQWIVPLGQRLELRLMASAYAGRYDSAGVLREEDVERGTVDRFATYDPKQGGNAARAQLVAAIGETTPSTRFEIAPYAIFRSMRLRENFTGYLRHPTDGDGIQQLNDALTVGARAHYRKRIKVLSSRDAIAAGLSLRTDWITQSQRDLSNIDDSVLATDVDVRIRAVDVGAWLDGEVRVVPRVTVQGGLRVDGLAYESEDLALPKDTPGSAPRARGTTGTARSAMGAQASPRVTATVRTWTGLDLVASYGEGFRSPQARSLAEGEKTPFARSRSFEGGLRFRDGQGFEGHAAAFRTTLDQDLVFDPTTARNEKVPATERVGVAADLVVRPTTWLVSSTSVTFTNATFTATEGRYEAGNLLPYVPRFVVRQDLAAQVGLGTWLTRAARLQGGFAVTGLIGRPLPYGEMGHDIVLFDAKATIRWGEVALAVDALNLLDAAWYDGQFVYASSFDRASAPSLVPARHITAGSPRTVFVSLSFVL